MRASSFSRNASYTCSCTSIRRVAVHFWPADQNAPANAASAARSSSASGKTTNGLWPPSSSCTRQFRAVASLRTAWPTGTDPVKEIARTSGFDDELGPDRRTCAGEHVQYAGRQAGLCEGLRDVEAGAGRLVSELEHDGVPIDERGCELPDGDRDREVPRRDQARRRRPVGAGCRASDWRPTARTPRPQGGTPRRRHNAGSSPPARPPCAPRAAACPSRPSCPARSARPASRAHRQP